MKITKSTTHPKINRYVRAFVRRRLDSATGFVILACFLTAANSSRAGEPDFITTPPAMSLRTTFTQAQGPLSASGDLNQAAMSQIMNQLDQRQFQLSTAPAEDPLFLPQSATIRRAK